MPKISWTPNDDLEKQDRLQFLALTPSQRWEYMMKLIMLTYPKEKVTFDKRKIEWR